MEGVSRMGDISWSSIPTDFLLAELSRRDEDGTKPQCGTGKKGKWSYDTALHVFALILILALSTLACGFPLLSKRASKSRRQSNIIFLCQHFGTGVLLATAFVHLLPTAFSSLTDPCLPFFFSEGYKPLPGLVAMVAALVVVGIESYLTTRGAGHSHSHDIWDDDDEEDEQTQLHMHGGSLAATRGPAHRPMDIAMDDVGDSQGLMAGVSPLPESTPTILRNGKSTLKDDHESLEDFDDDRESVDLELRLDELDPAAEEGTQSLTRPFTKSSSAGRHVPLTPSTPQPATPEEQKRQMLQCLLLEAGILFHSVFIGMALSVATGPPFVVFLVAIAFHQSFEGLALGSRIAAIQFPRSSPRPWLMVLAYGTTTPFGQLIGLIVHRFYDPLSQTGLLMVGFMNAISSGLLLFAGLVQLLAEDFLTEKSYRTLGGRRRIHAFAAVIGGATLMAVVGAFA